MVNIKELMRFSNYNLQRKCEGKCTKYEHESIKEDTKEEEEII